MSVYYYFIETISLCYGHEFKKIINFDNRYRLFNYIAIADRCEFPIKLLLFVS